MIDMSGMGSASGNTSNVFTATLLPVYATVDVGDSGINTFGGSQAGAAGGTGGNVDEAIITEALGVQVLTLGCGSAGGRGERNGGVGNGTIEGGRGGGALYMECGGAWNFTTSSGISVAGDAGNEQSTYSGPGS